MESYAQAKQIKKIISRANDIVIIQADNPDTDSLASSLALEQILTDLGKNPLLYCGVDLPSYLLLLPGSDRVSKDLPNNFDAVIIVDTSSLSLLTQLQKRGLRPKIASSQVIIIDHHSTAPTVDFANSLLSPKAVACGEVIYELASQLQWPLDLTAKKLLTIAIMSDSLGLTSEATSARSIHIVAELVEGGVSLAELESARRDGLRRDSELIHYKGRLLQRVEFVADERLALLTIPWEEIERFSPLYNPAMLVIDDMRLAKNTQMAIVFKLYGDGKITAKIRTNYGSNVADKLAESFGGGGHPYASGFKITDGTTIDQLKTAVTKEAISLLGKQSQKPNEAI